jgi:hypothetical protein
MKILSTGVLPSPALMATLDPEIVGSAALADAAGLSEPTIKRYETTVAKVSPEAVSKIVDALKAAGIEFTNGGRPGVRLRKAK